MSDSVQRSDGVVRTPYEVCCGMIYGATQPIPCIER